MNRVFTDTSNLDRLISRIEGNTEEIIKAIAFQVEALAKLYAPVDTGALRASIYVRFSDSNPETTVTVEELPKPSSQFGAVIGPSVEYAIYVEFGTSIMSAQPYLVPALREVERQLEEYFRNIVK